jgi:hypothetical protein
MCAPRLPPAEPGRLPSDTDTCQSHRRLVQALLAQEPEQGHGTDHAKATDPDGQEDDRVPRPDSGAGGKNQCWTEGKHGVGERGHPEITRTDPHKLSGPQASPGEDAGLTKADRSGEANQEHEKG